MSGGPPSVEALAARATVPKSSLNLQFTSLCDTSQKLLDKVNIADRFLTI